MTNFEIENIKKYGDKQHDEIAYQYNKHFICGVSLCIGLIRKYKKRFFSNFQFGDLKTKSLWGFLKLTIFYIIFK